MTDTSKPHSARGDASGLNAGADGTRAAKLMDVARAAGVSRTTASAALGGSGRISAATRERVQAVAQRLGYVANPAARHLQGRRRGAIGLYVPDNLAGFAFYMEYAFGAAAAARESGFALTLLPRPQDAPMSTVRAQVDGILIVDPLVDDAMTPALLNSGLPVVASERYLGDEGQPEVTVETEHGEAIAALLDHVRDAGARAPALLNMTLQFAWCRLVDDVYRRWCLQHDVEPRVRPLPDGCAPEEVRAIGRRLFEEPSPPDAIVSAPDGTALAAASAVRDAGLSVGSDVLVASCVDSLAMQYAAPPITAIDIRPREIGRDGAAALLAILRGEEPPPTVRRGRPQLVIRASTTPTPH